MYCVIITGANGYIGKQFIKKYKKKIKFVIYNENINNKKKISEFISNTTFDVFIHLAALLRSKKKNKQEFYKTNSNSLKYISQEVCKKNKRLLFLSSSHVYKSKKKKLKENDELKPSNIYGKSKLRAENFIHKNINKFCIIRLFNLYGANMPSGTFFTDINLKIKNNEKIIIDNSIRDFVHIDDLCRLIYFIIKNNIKGTYNACSGVPTPLINVINFAEKKLNKKSNLLRKKTKTVLVGSNIKIKKRGFKFINKNIFKI